MLCERLWVVAKFVIVAMVACILTIKYGHYFYSAPVLNDGNEVNSMISEKDLKAIHIIAIPEELLSDDESDEAYARNRLIARPNHYYHCIERGNMLKHRGFMFKLQPMKEFQGFKQ